jgi:hypothetical protein
LKHVGGTVYLAGVILGCLAWFAVTAATWLLLFLLDNLLALPPIVRLPLAIAGGVVTIGCFWKYVVGPLRNRRSNDEIALMLEEQFGVTENVLINTVQFEEMPYGERQKDFVLATADAASRSWQRLPLRQLWQPRRMGAWWSAAGLLLGIWSAYIVLAPDQTSSAFARYTRALAEEPGAAEVPSLRITPADDVTIAEHENLEVTLDVAELAAGGELLVYPSVFWKEGEGRVSFRRGDGNDVKMRPVVGKPTLYTHTFEDVRRSFALRVFVDDRYSRSIQVTVNPMPKIVESRFTITPPAYVRRSPQEQAGPPNPVECLPNSKLGVEIRLDRPVERLRWQWAAGEVEFEGTDPLAWRAGIAVGEAAGGYDLTAHARSFRKPVHLATGAIMLKSDHRPEVRFVETDMSRVVSPGARLTLQIEANDDYGLSDLQVTWRRALGGSRPETVREWSFGEPPGARGRVEKRTELTIEPSNFVPGNKYFIEARAKDFCPTNEWTISEPILISVKGLDERLEAPKGSNFEALYAALEEAIANQKQALDATRNLKTNLDDIWLDMSRKPRTKEAIQALLDKSRGPILTHQLRVRDALIRGAGAVADKADRLALRMLSIGQVECVQANDRSFAAGRRRLAAGELKPANGPIRGSSFPPDQPTQTVRFEGRPARYFGLAVTSVDGWQREVVRIRNLQLLDENGKPCDSAGWKIVDAPGVQNAQNAWTPNGVEAPAVPCFLVCDMGSERVVSGIACEGKQEQAPKQFALYLSSGAAPKMTVLPPDQKHELGEIRLLESVQESIYNQLVALKGGEVDRLAAAKEEIVRMALGEKGEEPDASVGDKLQDLKYQLKEWLGEHEKNTEERKLVMATPAEDLTDKELEKLDELNVKKRKLARDLEKLVDDLARAPWDHADETQVKVAEETLHKFRELSEMANQAAKKAEKKLDASWNLDTTCLKTGRALETGQAPPRSGELVEPGDSEDPEDTAKTPKLGPLPSELPIRIMDLAKALGDMPEFDAESGSQQMDHSNPKGGQATDNLDSATAAGQMSDKTPNPKATTKGRGNLGRAGRADGQMVAEKAPAVPNNEVKIPPRTSNSPAEQGKGVKDQDNVPATAVGLGKMTGSPSDFAKSGKLPPDALRNMRLFAGQNKEIRENIRALLLTLQGHHLPTTDLERALRGLEQINSGREGVDVRRVLSDVQRQVRAAHGAVAGAIELRRQQRAAEKDTRALDSARQRDAVPDGFEELVSEYFKAVADQSADKK